MRAKARAHRFTHIFFHPDCNRWSRSCTGSADAFTRPVADCTASGELHPALKTSDSVVEPIILCAGRNCNPCFGGIGREANYG